MAGFLIKCIITKHNFRGCIGSNLYSVITPGQCFNVPWSVPDCPCSLPDCPLVSV